MCNRPVSPIEHYHPVYDDGGSVDSFDVDIEIPEFCIECRPNVSHISVIGTMEEDQDELPF